DVKATRDNLKLDAVTVKPDFTGNASGNNGIAVKVGTQEIGRILDKSDTITDLTVATNASNTVDTDIVLTADKYGTDGNNIEIVITVNTSTAG
ncbi:hypothetical protein COX73_01115, partial [bacterium (Candidatus Gribaldobacteria) CG_4_10_14_0_2_um_filter_36_18]